MFDPLKMVKKACLSGAKTAVATELTILTVLDDPDKIEATVAAAVAGAVAGLIRGFVNWIKNRKK